MNKFSLSKFFVYHHLPNAISKKLHNYLRGDSVAAMAAPYLQKSNDMDKFEVTYKICPGR